MTGAVALDCEMIGAGDRGEVDLLASVSVVNEHFEVLYHRFVEPFCQLEVTDYRTKYSGIRPTNISYFFNDNVVSFEEAQRSVQRLIEGRVLVGHDIEKDLKVLQLTHSSSFIRDISLYAPFKKYGKGQKPGLKILAKAILNRNIQQGEHSSLEDALATMALYKKAVRINDQNLRSASNRCALGDIDDVSTLSNAIRNMQWFFPSQESQGVILPEVRVRNTYKMQLKSLLEQRERERRYTLTMERFQEEQRIYREQQQRKEEEKRRSEKRWCIFLLVSLFSILLVIYCDKWVEKPQETPKNGWFS